MTARNDRTAPPPLARIAALAAAAAVVAALAWAPRTATNLTVPHDDAEPDRWFTVDPDGLYHARRLARLRDEGAPVAERDPYLSFPDGAAIPWPPYYTYVLAAAVGPGLPRADGVEERERIERAVARAPRAWAVATAALLALCASRLARAARSGPAAQDGAGLAPALAGAIVAGGTFALARASIWVSALGVGDHHAWISLLVAALTGLFVVALSGPGSARRDPALGAAAGVFAGVALGSWVASLVFVLLLQAALGWMLLRHARAPRPGLVGFGLAFHLAAAATLAPAVLSSPWKEQLPWMVVNLSWFHLAHLLLGAAVFVPLLRLPAEARAFRAYPWIVAAALGLLGLALAAVDAGPGRGIREGFAWAGRTNAFMGYVAESQPMWGGGLGGLQAPLDHLGLGALLLAPAWAWAAWRALRGDSALVAPVVLAPVLLFQALVQRRFADNLAVVGCLLLGWAAARCVAAPRCPALLRRAPVAAGLALAFVLAANGPVVAATWPALRAPRGFETVPALAERHRANRDLYRWLGRDAGSPADRSVLAPWSHGHALEQVADRPTVATNFGLYVGEDAYRDPYRFLLTDDLAAAEQLLVRRRARHVLVTGAFPETLPIAIEVARPGEAARYLADADGDVAAPGWYACLGARLLHGGAALDAGGAVASTSVDFLRLVHASPGRVAGMALDPRAGAWPWGYVWEHVPGARLVARGAPGETLRLALDVEYPGGYALRWTGAATVGADGVAELRVPYNTDEPNGDGRVVGRPVWELGERRGRVLIAEDDVREGRRVELRGA